MSEEPKRRPTWDQQLPDEKPRDAAPLPSVKPDSAKKQIKVFLVERLPADFEEVPRNTNTAPTDNSTVTIAVVRDPERLLRERGLGFHGDVVDLLTDLVLDAMDQDAGEGSSE